MVGQHGARCRVCGGELGPDECARFHAQLDQDAEAMPPSRRRPRAYARAASTRVALQRLVPEAVGMAR